MKLNTMETFYKKSAKLKLIKNSAKTTFSVNSAKLFLFMYMCML